jgi:hypothetical protein
VFFREPDEAIYQIVASEIGKFVQGYSAAEMGFTIGIASRTTQGTFTSDFD